MLAQLGGAMARTAAAMSLVLLAGAQSGCVIIADGGSSTSFRTSQSLTADYLKGSPMAVETQNGSVQVVGGKVDRVSVEAEIRGQTQERADKTRVRAERSEGGVLRVWVEWPDDRRQSNEGVSLVIRTPDCAALNVRTVNGAVKLAGLSGTADVGSSNAPVEAVDQGGDVVVGTTNGRVLIERPLGGVRAKTTNAPIRVSDAAKGVELATSNRGIVASLTSGNAGPVTIVSSNAPVQVQVGSAFSGEMVLNTTNASMSLPGGANVVSKSRDRATLRFGPGDGVSKVTTSNGMITVKAE